MMLKNSGLLLVLLAFCLGGCKKQRSPMIIADHQASVQLVKYACGPACDASAYVIKTSQNELFTPRQLDMDFHIHQLMVNIRFIKTGKFNASFTGPHYELIEIVEISR